MDKKLEDMTDEEISIQVKKNGDNVNKFMTGIEKASQFVGITKEQGMKFIDILNEYMGRMSD